MKNKKEYSIFLVDDNTLYRSSLKKSLEQKFGASLKVTEYTTGEECFKDLNNIPDMVILDYYLKNDANPNAMDGIKILQRFKSLSKNITVIMLSGQDTLEVAVDSIKNGAYEYIPKTESAFIRVRNTLQNAMESAESSKKNSKYYKLNIFLVLVIVILIFVDIFWNR